MAARKSSGPRIVAELGRPETPDETAARKAETSRVHRAAQNPVNLVIALLASLGIVLFLVLVVARPNTAMHDTVDFRSVAERTQPGIDEPLLVPDVPADWEANRAEARPGTSDGSFTWYIGLITPADGYIAVNQGINEGEAWVADLLKNEQPTGERTIDGVTWQVFDQRDTRDPGNFAYSMTTQAGASSVVLNGTATDADFDAVAESLAGDILDAEGGR
ncbi:DUF4245 domain-containing protein [Salinibacterium sp. ZJ454]|uniref:DUF4245 domain-containing protein n=1 Tax=Salinibacterium sp. ZJ454 TaxID=2708339 RepID=UPI0014229074|nr:DUF4245 domain-containing protein [Salinibacterium sp. ZJ454]